MRTLVLIAAIVGGLVVVATAALGDEKSPAPTAAKPSAQQLGGQALYDRFCLACHGSVGDGRGPGAPWLWPRPRDFSRGQYKWRSTPTGYPPTDRDLALAIRYGARGTSMHGFANTLTDEQVDVLVGVVKHFAPKKFARTAEVVPVGVKPALAAADIERGKQLYKTLDCGKCHGDGGAGNGPAAAELRDAKDLPAAPFDLTKSPLRRPMPPGADKTTSIYTSLVTGLSGTPMPSYQDAAPPADLWAVAAYVASISPDAGRRPLNKPVHVDPIASELDRKNRITKTGYWPGNATDKEAIVWGKSIARMGKPPAKLAPAQASLEAERCARCHNKQFREWKGSVHAEAGSPGLHAQLITRETQPQHGAFVESCQRCHNPLAEQSAMLRSGHKGGDDSKRDYAVNPEYSAELRDEGLNCAACHVRGWTRHGPKLATDSRLLELPGYPLKQMSIYERSDFCLACHQLTPSNLVAGRPLLNTYREWLEGPYMKRGIQCQHCHMPNREHSFKGVHDAETFRQGYTLDARAARSANGVVSVRARMTNSGAGHYLPTTPTPAAFLSIKLLDAGGKVVKGATSEKRIGRHIEFGSGGFRDIEDTRIKPGETLEHAGAWKGGRVADAVWAEVRVRVEPDEYYERFYRSRLAAKLTKEQRELFTEALARAEASHFIATIRRFRIKKP